MYPISLTLYIFLILLTVDGIIELSFITNMVGWLHRRAGKTFDFEYQDATTQRYDPGNNGVFTITGRPQHLLVDQGHTSNGAAGTAFIIVGIGGFLILCLRRFSPSKFRSGFGVALYNIWLVFTILSALLTLTALIYTFTVTNSHAGQTISPITAAVGLNPPTNGPEKPYPLLSWTPENWFTAMLQLDLIHQSDVNDIKFHLALMKGWRWNLIPLFILGAIVAGLAWFEAFKRKKVVSGTARYRAAPKA